MFLIENNGRFAVREPNKNRQHTYSVAISFVELLADISRIEAVADQARLFPHFSEGCLPGFFAALYGASYLTPLSNQSVVSTK
ncbi:hypothetical protein Agau_P200514 (plasmid) [Agrobacterium tumefaciens F2]|nr:hypothetical protein Agau_P200514 [Agrobacterium tumefaciens F2]